MEIPVVVSVLHVTTANVNLGHLAMDQLAVSNHLYHIFDEHTPKGKFETSKFPVAPLSCFPVTFTLSPNSSASMACRALKYFPYLKWEH